MRIAILHISRPSAVLAAISALASLATPIDASQPALDRVSTSHRKLIEDRSQDILILEGDITIDAFRARRMRELLATNDWSRIKSRECAELGIGHSDFQDRRYIGQFGPSAPLEGAHHGPASAWNGLPDLYQISENDWQSIPGWYLFVEIPTVNKMIPDVVSENPRIFASSPHVVRVKQIIEADRILASVGYVRGVAERPPFGHDAICIEMAPAGLVDGDELKGDFFLKENGVYSYTDTLGGRRTVKQYQYIPIPQPLSAEEFATKIESGEMELTQWKVRKRGGERTQYEWKLAPIRARFAKDSAGGDS